MSNNPNMPQEVPMHAKLADIIKKEELAPLQNVLFKPQEPVSEEDFKAATAVIKKAIEVFGEDEFAEPLFYLASTRRGLRVTDLKVLLGEDWDEKDFVSLITCFGFPFLGFTEGIVFVPTLPLRSILLSLVDQKEQLDFQKDIAYYLLKLEKNDPLRQSELLFHLLQSGMFKEAADTFADSQGESMQASAQLLANVFTSGEEGENIVKEMLKVADHERFNLYRRFINEVFVALTQKGNVEIVEKFIAAIQDTLKAVMGEKNSIDNIQLLALSSLRYASVFIQKKDMETVKTHFDQGLSLIDRLMAQNPPLDAFSWNNVDAIFNIGMICVDMRQPKAAEHSYDIALDLLAKKIEKEPAESTRHLYQASWYVSICRVFEQINQKDVLKRYFDQGKSVLENALKMKADFASANSNIIMAQQDLMVMYNDFADLCYASGYIEEAQVNYDNALALSERMAASHQEDLGIQVSPTIAYDRLGRMYAEISDMAKAKEYFTKSLELRQELEKKYPQEFRLTMDIAGAYHNLASLYANSSDKKPAEKYLKLRIETVRKVYDAQPQNEQIVLALLDAMTSLADFYYVNEKFEAALEAYRNSEVVIKPMLGKQVTEYILNRIAGIHYKIGMTCNKLSKNEDVVTNMKTAAELWKQLSEVTKNPVYADQLQKANEFLAN